MSFIKSVGKLAQTAVGAVMVPIDLVREAIPTENEKAFSGKHLKPRLKKLRENFVEAIDGIDE